ncbi:alpha-amylase family glycosyl hydrolase [Simiduia agarivorans]|uniref:Alpha-amylase n=1 Tax=Simiduia agarivorans (strain DSM 21679 / JCM 13881 / BCRC 17597 / SA1) TaxID=1117647 RepID=K4KZH4_SIMAS|nr:alpha-amylase family glycosyl hydrolase [Simiduia agarivorans]AFU99322.1 alpha-amylase [Simiduia agarivorans SA1 = DSM 21679]
MRYLVVVGVCLGLLLACGETGTGETKKADEVKKESLNDHKIKPYVTLAHPDWSADAVLYQLNTRQFTPEGSFRAAARELPRLKALGVDIIWLMPIHPIGEENRKGSLGSPYSVRDYRGVNPELGTPGDFRAFVEQAHALGLKVILDWVANHSAWDNPLRFEQPDWYERDYKGDFRPTPWWDWSDIIDLDYSQPALRHYMADAMVYWVREFGVDGFRCDVAGFVPIDFWEAVRAELEQIKLVFLLAEWESRDLHARAFDATYAWSWHEKMKHLAKGDADVTSLFVYYSWNESAFPREAYRMTYVENHDSNAWEGTVQENFGAAYPAVLALSFVGEGMPLIYNGMEAGNDRRLAFFERDPIQWRVHPTGDLLRSLIQLRKQEQVLWNGQYGERMVHVPNSQPTQVLSFVRGRGAERVLAVFNFSAEPQTTRLQGSLFPGTYRHWSSGEERRFTADTEVLLAPWEFGIWLAD